MICDTIRELRERAGVSQAALARRVGVTRSAVNAWEMGLSIPTTPCVAELAQFFRVSADYMLRALTARRRSILTACRKKRNIFYIR